MSKRRKHPNTQHPTLITQHSLLSTHYSALITQHSALITQHFSRITFHPSLLEIFLRQRCLLIFRLPVDSHHPPACAVVHQLNTVDAARKRLFPGLVPCLVSTEGMKNLSKRLRLAGYLIFEKAFFD